MSLGIDDDPGALRQILAAIPEVVVVVDYGGTIRYINHVEENYRREEVIGTQADTIMLPDSKKIFWNALRSVFERGGEEEYESEVLDPQGEVQWYHSRMRPVHKNGRVVAVMLMATNITELKETRRRVGQLERLLPICSWCDRIQDESGEWETVEQYVASNTDTMVSHGLCPVCLERELEGEVRKDGGTNGSAA